MEAPGALCRTERLLSAELRPSPPTRALVHPQSGAVWASPEGPSCIAEQCGLHSQWRSFCGFLKGPSCVRGELRPILTLGGKSARIAGGMLCTLCEKL